MVIVDVVIVAAPFTVKLPEILTEPVNSCVSSGLSPNAVEPLD